ncbi:MAG: ABC transporter ATP-binding protein [Mariprofundus sp.]
MKNVMQISGLAVHRGDRTLFSGLNCTFHSSEVVVVLGPNGAGKSSLLLALAGLIPFSGLITLQGRSLCGFSRAECARRIAWQGDLPPTEFGLTVMQRLELAGEHSDADITSAVDVMDISRLLMKTLGELSSGERQRVELVALMLRDTPVWVLDEPTTHLDLKHQVQCLNMLRSQAEQGRAIITVLHDLQQAATIADRVVIINGCGGAEYGEVNEMLDITKLSGLFEIPLLRQGKAILPDYGEE